MSDAEGITEPETVRGVIDNYVVVGREHGSYTVEHNGEKHTLGFGLPGLRVDPEGVALTRVDPLCIDHRVERNENGLVKLTIIRPRYWRHMTTQVNKDDTLNLSIYVWHPTEHVDPQHPWCSSAGVGMNLTIEEGWALRDALDAWLTGDNNT